MTREEELRAQCAKNDAWWADHGPLVRATSAQREREHFGRMMYDHDYRAREKLGEQLNRAAVRNMGLNTVRTEKPAPYAVPIGGELAFTGEKVGRIGDAHDAPLPEYIESAASIIRKYEREMAEKEFEEHAAAETGMQLSEQEYQKKRRADKLIRVQSEEIARRLCEAGVDAYRADEYKTFVYWIHSKTVEELPAYRRICLLPFIAAMTRAPKLAALEFFLEKNQYARFWTFTTGTRCTAEEIPARLDWLYGKLRELNKQLGRRWGIQICFRSTEFGSLEKERADAPRLGAKAEAEESGGVIERDAEGRALYHPHAHCVVLSTRGFIGKSWGEAIDFVHSFWRRGGERIHWDAGKRIHNARECCKYVTKPGDLLKLSNDELRAFYEATAKRRLVRPMGILADEIRHRREACRTLRRKRVGKSLRWAEVLNHNRLTLETEAEKAERQNLEDAYALTEECQRLAAIEPPSYPGAGDGGRLCKRPNEAEVTKVMARIGPAAGPTALKEPRVLVMTNRIHPDVHQVTSHPLVVRLWAQTVEHWEAGRALDSYRVHTGTLSGKEFQDELRDFDPPEPLDPILQPMLATNLSAS